MNQQTNDPNLCLVQAQDSVLKPFHEELVKQHGEVLASVFLKMAVSISAIWIELQQHDHEGECPTQMLLWPAMLNLEAASIQLGCDREVMTDMINTYMGVTLSAFEEAVEASAPPHSH